jgi:hypothetical protein
MRLTLNRGARRRIAEAGGALTLEACSDNRCWCSAHLRASAGAPADPSAYQLTETSGVRVFTRGQIRSSDGQVRPANTVVPHNIRVRERRGRLIAHVG